MHQRKPQEVVRSIAIRLSKGASSAIHRMKYSPANWLCTAGPGFDVSLGFRDAWLLGAGPVGDAPRTARVADRRRRKV